MKNKYFIAMCENLDAGRLSIIVFSKRSCKVEGQQIRAAFASKCIPTMSSSTIIVECDNNVVYYQSDYQQQGPCPYKTELHALSTLLSWLIANVKVGSNICILDSENALFKFYYENLRNSKNRMQYMFNKMSSIYNLSFEYTNDAGKRETVKISKKRMEVDDNDN